MLCPACRRQVEREATFCGACGRPLGGGGAGLELVVDAQTRVALTGELTIGRGAGSGLRLGDPSVSRTHARIVAGNGEGPRIEDAGSSHGTFLDGVRVTGPMPLYDGARIRVGDRELLVERRRAESEAGRTVIVPAAPTPPEFDGRPMLRPGFAMKRLEASEGRRRFVLRDLDSGAMLRFSPDDAALLERLDGTRTVADLAREADELTGPTGPARLARLLADLGERGMIVGVASSTGGAAGPGGRLRRLIGPHVKAFSGTGPFFDRLYRRGGWVLFTRPALIAICTLAAAGLAAFFVLLVGRYGTPFVVASKIGIGGVVFLLGRFALVAIHELAHGLTMASFGRRANRVGFKAIVIFPYAFVDTTEAWFEPRRRRIAISAAGPLSDLALGGLFSLLCLVLAEGTVRDICFQLAFGAYVGAFFNLNPFLERDGYHILVDVLREPGLRRRAREQFSRRLSGRGQAADDGVLMRYSLWGIAWSLVGAAFAVYMTLRYAPLLRAVAPDIAVTVVVVTVWVAVLIPVIWVVGKPLVDRVRSA